MERRRERQRESAKTLQQDKQTLLARTNPCARLTFHSLEKYSKNNELQSQPSHHTRDWHKPKIMVLLYSEGLWYNYKTSQSGWGSKLHPKFQISKIVKEKGSLLRRKEQKHSQNRFKVVTKFLRLLPVHGAALSHLSCRIHEPVDVTMALQVCSFSLSREKGPADGRCNIF